MFQIDKQEASSAIQDDEPYTGLRCMVCVVGQGRGLRAPACFVSRLWRGVWQWAGRTLVLLILDEAGNSMSVLCRLRH